VVHNLFPLALRVVEHRGDLFLTVSVIACDVEEFAGRTRHAAPELMDEGCAGRAILEHRDGVVVGHTGEFGVVLGEAPNVLAQALSRLLLAVAQLPLLVAARVGALEVPDEDAA
jgi:hypothetical protein